MSSVSETIIENEETYSVSETIENGNLCVSASPGIWIVDGILYWPPPDEQIDRSMMIRPGPDWTPHMCKVLRKNIATYDESLEVERFYSEHRDSGEFRKKQALKQLKRDHPVNHKLSDSSDVIDVNEIIEKIDAAKGGTDSLDADVKPNTQTKVNYHKFCTRKLSGNSKAGTSKKPIVKQIMPKNLKKPGSISVNKLVPFQRSSKQKNTKLDDVGNLKRPRYDNFLKSGNSRPRGIFNEQAKKKRIVSTTVLERNGAHDDVLNDDADLSDGKQGNAGDDRAIATASASSQRNRTHCDVVSNVEGARSKNIFTSKINRTVPTATITKREYLKNNVDGARDNYAELTDENQENGDFDHDNAAPSGSSQLSNTFCNAISNVEDHRKNRYNFCATSSNTTALANNENEATNVAEFEIDNFQSANHRSKINVLDNILLQKAHTTTRPQLTSFEDTVKKHLDELSKAQRASENRQLSFEARIEKKLDSFFNNQSLLQGSNRSMQNRTHQLQHRERDHFNNQSDMRCPSRSKQNQNYQWQQREEHDDLVDDVTPDFEKFEELDENFPIEKFENVAELEYNIRKDVELLLILKSRLDELTAEDPKKAIRLKMKYLVTDPVLEKYTWRGTEKKRPFKQLKSINNLIFGSVRRQFKNYKQFQYKNYMVQWIKHAKTRQREVTYKYPERKISSDSGDDDDDDFDMN